MINVKEISGISDFEVGEEKVKDREVRTVYRVGSRAFLVDNKNTLEVRCDEKLGKLLRSKFESVMESRYFGRGGIEIVKAGKQLEKAELEDLVRLSYNLTREN